MAEDDEPGVRAAVILDAELDRFIANLGAHPLALDELRQIAEDVYVSLSQSQAAGFDYAFCLNSGGRIYFFFKAGELPSFDLFRRKPDCLLSRPICNVLQFSANVRLIYPFSSFGKAISGEHGFDHGRVVPREWLARLRGPAWMKFSRFYASEWGARAGPTHNEDECV